MEVICIIFSWLWGEKIGLFIGFVAIFLFEKLLKRNRPNIPGPYPWPIIGNAMSLGSKPQYSMQAMAKKYGPIFMMKLGGMDVLVLNDYASIKEALGRQKRVFEGRPHFNSFAKISQGKGIVFNSPETQGQNWRKLKHTVVNHLHKFVTGHDTQAQLVDHVRKETIELIDTIHRLCQQNPEGSTEPETIINVSIANIACALMFGHRYDYTNKEFQDLVSLNRQFGDVVSVGSQIDVMPWIKIFPPFKKAMKTFDFLTNRLNNWMLSRSSEHRSSYVHGITRDFVDTFIASSIEKPQGLLSQDTIMALTTDVFGAAQDTLSTTVQWLFIYMMYFPEIQRKVQFEIDSVLGDTGLPDVINKNNFPYTMAVMHEIFRHSSFTATTIPHSTTADTEIGGYHVPKGMLVFVNQFAANHDPRQWENPGQFSPERFLNSQGQLIPNAQERYLAFSYGSRKCPGDELTRILLLHFTVTLFNLCEVQSDPRKPTTLEGVFNLSSRPKSLATKLRIRKPVLMNELVSSISHLSPNIPTVFPDASSFESAQPSQRNNKIESAAFQYSQILEYSDDEFDSSFHSRKRRMSSQKESFREGISKSFFSTDIHLRL